MYAFHLFISADPYLGRLDYSLLSDQALMEMFIEGFDEQTKKTYQDKHGMYLDVCEWSCIECDDDGRVVEVDIGIADMSGSLDLFYVPPKVQELYVGSGHKSDLTGSVELEHLPVGVYVLILTNNRLTGEIDLPQLPDGMQILNLNNNQLTGEIDLTHLPDGMRIIYLQNNQLTGEINLTHLSGPQCGSHPWIGQWLKIANGFKREGKYVFRFANVYFYVQMRKEEHTMKGVKSQYISYQ